MCRLVRGVAGIPWSASKPAQPALLAVLTVISACQSRAETARADADALRKLATALLRSNNVDNDAKLGHQEGRHAGLPGAHTLLALATAEGSWRAALVLPRATTCHDRSPQHNCSQVPVLAIGGCAGDQAIGDIGTAGATGRRGRASGHRCHGMYGQAFSSLSALRSGTCPPASMKTCLQAATHSACRALKPAQGF